MTYFYFASKFKIIDGFRGFPGVVVFGGYDGDEIFNDTWVLNLTSWVWKRISTDAAMGVYFNAACVTSVCLLL